MPNRIELKGKPPRTGRKGIMRVIRLTKRAEAEARNAETPIYKRSRKTDAWKQFLPK